MKKIAIAVAISCGFIFAGTWLLLSSRNNQAPDPVMVVDHGPYCDDGVYADTGQSEADLIQPELALSKIPYGPDEDFLEISDGQTLHSILRPLNVSEQEIALLSQALRPELRVTDLAAKDQYRFKLAARDDGTQFITLFVIRKIDPFRVPKTYRAVRKVDAAFYRVSVHAPMMREEKEHISVAVNGTLYQSFNQYPFGTELMQALMGVFLWQMRMPQDVLAGDFVDIIVTKRYIYDDFIGYGRILSAIYQQKHRSFTAIYFQSKDKKVQGYFDEQGRSLEKEFAASPVHETFATSDQKLRLHPVRKIRIRHNGIDYRGAIGTEFFSIADGYVIEKRFDVNVGNMIRIQHNYGVHSEYFHANSLADNVSVGQRVKRGQLLGTIGRTGRLCTGPHLHMGLYTMNGEKKKFIDLTALRKTLRSAPNISSAYQAEYSQHQKDAIALITKYQNRDLATAKVESTR